MDDVLERSVEDIKVAERQFRLACTVNLAVTKHNQILDVPRIWTYGRHRVTSDEFGLRQDQADGAAAQLEMTATMVWMGAIRDALIKTFRDPKDSCDSRVVNAYQISRTIRNAFSHNMIIPKWSIDENCKDKTFSIENTIELKTNKLHDTFVESVHYGGPLAVFRFGRFVREYLLGSPVDLNRVVPPEPVVEMFQQGRLLMIKLGSLPDNEN